MKLVRLVERSLHTKSMRIEDGPIIPPSTRNHSRNMRRQITAVRAKNYDSRPAPSSMWDIAVDYRYIKRDGEPSLIGGGSIVFRRDGTYEKEIEETVRAFLDEVGIRWFQIEDKP